MIGRAPSAKADWNGLISSEDLGAEAADALTSGMDRDRMDKHRMDEDMWLESIACGL